ncbi:MAG: hypothetical protein WCH44_04060 [Betaproteobacteria bacterium]
MSKTLEPVDERQQPVPAGQPSGPTLLTNLANTVQPLIRYDLGDPITLGIGDSDCGCRLRVFEVSGRHDGAQEHATMARCCQLLRAFARRQGSAPIHIVAKTGATLARGGSGKVKRIVACDR